MDWSKTKTIFIITFLILDIFLGYQFFEKRSKSQLDIILEASIEDKLDAEHISYNDLPKVNEKENYLSGKSHQFSEKDLSKLENQEVILTQPNIIHSKFKKPLPLSQSNIDLRLQQVLKEYIHYGNSYTYWKQGEKDKKNLYFFQTYHGKPIYKNMNAMIVLHLNDKNEIVSYDQTLLDHVEKYEKKEEILPAIKAIEILYNKNLLHQGSHVTKVELGYYALVQFNSSQSEVLTPTWHIVVNNKEDYFVNAFEGQIINDDQNILE